MFQVVAALAVTQTRVGCEDVNLSVSLQALVFIQIMYFTVSAVIHCCHLASKTFPFSLLFFFTILIFIARSDSQQTAEDLSLWLFIAKSSYTYHLTFVADWRPAGSAHLGQRLLAAAWCLDVQVKMTPFRAGIIRGFND